MRIAVAHPQTPFVRGGAETHTENLVTALIEAGHEAEIVSVPWKWYPADEIVHHMAMWRSLDLTESNGMKIDAVIALKFPAYLVKHPRKIVWLIHQHRTAYELWDHPKFADLSTQPQGQDVRELIHEGDRQALSEAARLFTNSRNVKERLWNSLRIPAEPLYHPSAVTETLLEMPPGSYGDYVFYPSRLETLKRQSLAIEAMEHVKTDVQLLLVGKGPDEGALRELARELGVADRVRFEIGVPDSRLYELFLGARAVYFGPYDEDYGYVTLEGMAAERPVITLEDSGGPLEFVTDGQTGLVAPPEPKDIAQAFDQVFADPAAAQRMGMAGNQLVRSTVPRWPDVVARLLD